MPTLTASWRRIATLDTLQRSSHSLAVAGGKAYIFGGELKPRQPVDADVHVLDVEDGSLSTLSSATSSSTTSPWPPARVGAALTSLSTSSTSLSTSSTSLYLWGGRGGKDMSALTSDSNSIWKFDTREEKWEVVETGGERPEGRSYHSMCAMGRREIDEDLLRFLGAQDTLYLHAGCPSTGRLSTLHSLSLSTLSWSALPSAPEPGRGGTVLTALPGGQFLARFGGFAGYELGGLDVFNVRRKEWTSVEAAIEGGGEGPPKRSVHAFVGLRNELDLGDGSGKKVVALMAMGEREAAPKELGHDGAGFFHSDSYALLSHSSSPSALPEFSWLPLAPSGPSPPARGWLASALSPSGRGLVLHGGLDERNERLGDAWVLEVRVE
ncbi:Kelch repeat protein [Rhodotorula toruloides]|nr:Kelch repeat protein [Rhodotorula toruloides]